MKNNNIIKNKNIITYNKKEGDQIRRTYISGIVASTRLQMRSDLLSALRKGNDILEKMDDENYIKDNHIDIESVMEELNNQYEACTTMFRELNRDLEFVRLSERLINAYQRISIKYSTYLMNHVQVLDESIKKDQKVIEGINSKYESLGATVLNIVLTISVVSSMVGVLVHFKGEISLSIVLLCITMLLGSLLFVSSVFKEDKNYIMHIIICVVFLLLTCFSFYYTYEKCSNNVSFISGYFSDNSISSQYLEISDKEQINSFLKRFIPCWNNDKLYMNNKNQFVIDNIARIRFYKNNHGNVNEYNYEFILLDMKFISLYVDNDSLVAWMKENKIIID